MINLLLCLPRFSQVRVYIKRFHNRDPQIKWECDGYQQGSICRVAELQSINQARELRWKRSVSLSLSLRFLFPTAGEKNGPVNDDKDHQKRITMTCIRAEVIAGTSGHARGGSNRWKGADPSTSLFAPPFLSTPLLHTLNFTSHLLSSPYRLRHVIRKVRKIKVYSGVHSIWPPGPQTLQHYKCRIFSI